MIRLTRAAEKDLKKFEKGVRDFLVKNLYEIAANPSLGKRLKGVLKKYRSFHCSFFGTEYRIVYRIETNGDLIIIVMIGTRENIYKELKRRTNRS